MTFPADACGLIAGYASDLLLADPRRGHPVAAFGALAGRLEHRIYRDSYLRGAIFTAVLVGGVIGAGVAGSMFSRGPATRAVATALATWAVLGGTSLALEANEMGRLIRRRDLAAARSQLGALCGRDATGLAIPELARATVESVAENTSDAVVAPLFWGALAGLPGLLGYRAINTLDAMVGHRSTRYTRFGAASARLDDLANLVPARIAGVLAAVCAPMVGGSTKATWAVLRRDGQRHPSPNAGRVEAAFAGALGVTLGGRNAYAGHVEERGRLGDGRAVEPADIERAVRLSSAVSAAALALSAGLAMVRGARS